MLVVVLVVHGRLCNFWSRHTGCRGRPCKRGHSRTRPHEYFRPPQSFYWLGGAGVRRPRVVDGLPGAPRACRVAKAAWQSSQHTCTLTYASWCCRARRLANCYWSPSPARRRRQPLAWRAASNASWRSWISALAIKWHASACALSLRAQASNSWGRAMPGGPRSKMLLVACPARLRGQPPACMARSW